MLWWSMLEVALAAIAACLPSFSFFTKDGRLSKAFYRLLSFSNLSGSLSRWRAKSDKASSESDLKPEVGLDSYQMPDESWTNGKASTNSGCESSPVIYIQHPNENTYPSLAAFHTGGLHTAITEPKEAHVYQHHKESSV